MIRRLLIFLLIAASMLFRYNDTSYSTSVIDETLLVSYDDGHWSKPYFDCRGGDIWMMTYSVPFFGYRNGRYYFKWVVQSSCNCDMKGAIRITVEDNGLELQ